MPPGLFPAEVPQIIIVGRFRNQAIVDKPTVLEDFPSIPGPGFGPDYHMGPVPAQLGFKCGMGDGHRRRGFYVSIMKDFIGPFQVHDTGW